MRRAVALLLVVACDSSSPPTTCNGHAELCARTYDQVAFAGTHDAYASVANNVYAHDQTYSLTRQLTDGVRVLHIEILPYNGSPWLCHGICGLGGQSLVSGLQEVHDFLEANKTEVVTLLTESSQITTDQIEADFETADAKKYAHAHVLGEPWPTLGAMIERGERLVVFHADQSSTGGTPFDWMLDRFAWTWETPWNNNTSTDFGRCDADRGTKGNSIYVVDNYLENLLVETPDNAALTNTDPFLVDRLLHCKQVEGVMPNFVMVNFYEVGDVFHVVDVLNGVAPPPNDDLSQFPPPSFAGADAGTD
jgi:hypothetical protein